MPALGFERSELLKYAKILSENGEKFSAKRIYKFLIHQNGNDQEALVGLARLSDREPKESSLRSHLDSEYKAPSLQTIDEIEKSIANKELELSERIRLMVAVGVLSFKEGKSFQARYYFKQVLRFDIQNPRAHCGLAMVHWRRGRLHEAWLEFMAALDIDVSNLSALFGLLRVAQQLGRLSLARCYLKRFLEVNSDHFELWILLAKVDIAVGHVNEAEKILKRVLRKESHHKEAKELLIELSTS